MRYDNGLDQFKQWIGTQTEVDFDIETTGLSFQDDVITSMSFGNEQDQFVFETRLLDQEGLEFLLSVLKDSSICKNIHNALFDRTMVYTKYGVHIENVWDTYLVYRLLTGGYRIKKGMGKLDALLTEFGVELDKTVVESFIGNTDEYSETQLDYAAKDVKYLGVLKARQLELIDYVNSLIGKSYKGFDFMNIVKLEHDVQKPIVSIQSTGLIIDEQKWGALTGPAELITADSIKALNQYVLDNVELEWLVANKFVNDEEEIYLTKRQHSLFAKVGKSYDELMQDRDLLVNLGLLRPKHTLEINWASPAQRLRIFRYFIPNLASTDKRSLSRVKHPILKLYSEFNKASKIATSFGAAYLEKYRRPDSAVVCYPKITQIVRTGRMACSEPNLQQLPKTHRCCFKAPTNYKYVCTDYKSQELAVLATISKDPVFMQALSNGWDLHSVCAEMVFGEQWHNATLPDCLFKSNKQTCECPGHKEFRKTIKTVNFGLVYGMTEYKLSDTLDISVKEARDLIAKYFSFFPVIKGVLTKMSAFGLKHDFILTMKPYNRVRWLHEEDDPGRKSRASKNTPIQGASADMAKLALILVQKEIDDNKWDAKVVMAVHDRIDTVVRADQAQAWAKKQMECLEEAAFQILGHRFLKSDLNVNEYWE